MDYSTFSCRELIGFRGFCGLCRGDYADFGEKMTCELVEVALEPAIGVHEMSYDGATWWPGTVEACLATMKTEYLFSQVRKIIRRRPDLKTDR